MTVLEMSGQEVEPKTKEIEIRNNKKKRKKEKKEKKKLEDETQPPETPATINRLRKLGINTVYYDRGAESQTSSEDDNLSGETPINAEPSRRSQRQMEPDGTTALEEQESVETVQKDSREEEEEEEEDKKRSDESNLKEDEKVKEEVSADQTIPLDNAKPDPGHGSAGKEQVHRKPPLPSVSSSSSSDSDNDNNTGSSDDDDNDDDEDDATFHSNAGYFDIYMEELFGKILRQRGGGGRGGKAMEDHRPVYHGDGNPKPSSKSRKSRRSDRQKRRSKHVDTAAYEAPDFHQILPPTRSPSRSNLRSQGRPSSSSSGKVVRFLEEEPRTEEDAVREQLWRDKVQALGQLNHKRLARVPRRGLDGRKNRSDHHYYYNRQRNNNNNNNKNNNYTDMYARHYLLPPVRKYAAIQDLNHRSAGKSGFVSKTNSMGDDWVSSLRSGNFVNDVRRVEWTEDHPERPGIVRTQFDDGSNPYNRQLRTGWRSSLVSQKNQEALQEKKERNAMRFEYGRFLREVNRINASQ